MFRRVLIFLVCAGGVLTGAARAAAQTPPSPLPPRLLPALEAPAPPSGPPLSLQDAIDEALRNNPTLVALRREFDVARERPAQSRFLPPPSFNAQIWQWPIDTANPMNTNMFMLMIEQGIPGKGKRDLRATVAQKDAEIAGSQVAVLARETLSELKREYASLFVARKAAAVYAESAASLRQLADASESKYSSGRISQQDVLKPIVEVSTLYDDALMFRQQADLASARLNFLMGRSADAAIGELQDAADAAPLPPLDQLRQLGVEHQPELERARLEIERAKAALAAAKAEAKPDFMLQAGYMAMPRGTDAWTAQVGITWPSAPWVRGAADARIAETGAEVAAADARLHAAEATLQLTIQQAYVRRQTAERRMALLQTTILPQSRQTLELARVGYETDRVDFLTVLESERTLLGKQLDYWRVVGDLAEAQADLERAVGVDVPDAERR